MAVTDLGPQVDSAAQNPQSAAADGVSAASHPIDALIQADRYSKARGAATAKHRGLRFNKVIPAAAFPDSQSTGNGGLSDFANGGWY